MENKKNPTGYSWIRQLLISILGTSIGVGLTFGVNRLVDSSKQREARHQTAIMAVCDIDEISQSLKEEIRLEDSLFKVTMYVATHQELIDSLPIDTLDMAFKYLYDDPMEVKSWTADTKENAFNSGIDARMNLGNNKFYDNIQTCYYMRRSLIKVMEEAPVFCRPISKDVYEDFLQKLPPAAIDYNGIPHPNARRMMMKQVFAQGLTTLYIKRYFSRRNAYILAANKLELLNRENKLLMNITDKEIETYLKKNSDNVSDRISADMIAGTWEAGLNNNQQTFVFHGDSTVEKTFKMEGSFQIVLPEEQEELFVLTPLTIFLKGRWSLKGDSLITDFDASTVELLSFDMDVSNFPQAALERLKDSLEIKKEMMKNYILDGLRHQTFKDVCAVSLDRSASTMMWSEETINPTGKKETTTLQLYRKPK
ncbi:MAG: hypothetical protein IK103_00985 [Bacteroidales bacterium]|nr:hypothetical protein [Bacteroidales bacterium]